MDDLGVPPFKETPTKNMIHISIIWVLEKCKPSIVRKEQPLEIQLKANGSFIPKISKHVNIYLYLQYKYIYININKIYMYRT